jgi:hypothetical protein
MRLLGTIQRTVGALAALAGAGALVSVLAAADSAGSVAAPGAPLPAAAIPRLTAIAHHAAAINGDPHPEWNTAVLTTRAKALTSATPGDYVPGSADVAAYLVTMHGRFTATHVSVPPGAKAPAGICRWSSTLRPSGASTSASAPSRRQFRQPGASHLSDRPRPLTEARWLRLP